MMQYQKIRPLGHRALSQLWDGDVEITEKVDGSQYRFWVEGKPGIVGGATFHHGTKRTELHLVDGGVSDKLFNPVVRHMEEHGHKLPSGVTGLFGETLCKPKHNTLKYNVVPKGHLALWGGYDGSNDRWLTWEQLRELAFQLMVDVVPLVGVLSNSEPLSLERLDALLDRESYLGGPHIEGLVFKNYGHDLLIDDQYIPFLAGKFVSEKFKEQHVTNWSPRGDAIQDYIDSFNNEMLWLKSIQRLRDEGSLDYSPKDISSLMKEIHKDVDDEHTDAIKDFFYRHYIKQIKRRAGQGVAEFYKRWLIENSE